MRWYVDDSDLSESQKHSTPNIQIFGGILLPRESEDELRQKVECIKGNYGNPRTPIKWNFKDYKKLLENNKQIHDYDSFKNNMDEIRRKIFEALSIVENLRIIVSVFRSSNEDRNTLQNQKVNFIKMSFTNGLMRFGKEAQDKKAIHPEVIMDWPTGDNRDPFNEVYRHAYSEGKDPLSGRSYLCGPLEKLNFTDSILFTTMRHSTLLQLADLVVGVTRAFLNKNVLKELHSKEEELMKILLPKFRGFPKPIGRGISINSNEKKLKTDVDTALSPLLPK